MHTRVHSSTAPMSLLLVGLLAAACAGEDPDEPMAAEDGSTAAAEDTGEPPAESTGEAPAESTGEAPEDGSSGGDETTGGGIDVDALFDCEDPDFAVFQPLSGPGIDPDTGAFLEPLQENYVLHVTQILPKPEQLSQFLELSGGVIEEIAQTEGLVGFSLAQEPNCGFFYTMGVWRDEQSIFAFVASDAHALAMTKTSEVSITGRTTSWMAPASEMPLTWEMAKAAIADVEPLAVYE
jgi:quinol monooxygenase YgiN